MGIGGFYLGGRLGHRHGLALSAHHQSDIDPEGCVGSDIESGLQIRFESSMLDPQLIAAAGQDGKSVEAGGLVTVFCPLR